ncbi:conserved exported hypothetical protein [Syntrophobacter sp. SbD1]|nr:conserved exported hypothetical protein [Syntrophobacter sp. SbD1]
MPRHFIILLAALFLILVFSPLSPARTFAAQEETIVGNLVKHGKTFVVETDEGDYIVRGKDLPKMEGKMVEITGTISESGKSAVPGIDGTIDAKSVEEIEE